MTQALPIKFAYCSACVKKPLKTFTAPLNREKSFRSKIRKPKAIKVVLAAGCHSQDQSTVEQCYIHDVVGNYLLCVSHYTVGHRVRPLMYITWPVQAGT